MTRYKMRKDNLATEDGVNYTAYGIDIYEGSAVVKSIKDISLCKKRIKHLIALCEKEQLKNEDIDKAIYSFVDKEHSIELTEMKKL